MISRNIKLFLGVSILFAYVSIGIFGLFQFNHMAEKPMINCPYAQNGYAVCSNGFDHINDWRQFFNAIFPSLLTFSFLVLGLILYSFSKRNFFNEQSKLFLKWEYYLDNKKLYTYPNKIIKWLSLLENSPSFNAL